MSELREIIREVIAQSDDLSVESLTIETLSRITDAERARLFAESVPAVVASELHNTRFACRQARPAEPVQTIRSAKVAAIRDDWRRKLDAVYATPTGNKRLGDFSSDDLRALADTCSRMAEMNHTAITHPEWTPGHSLNDGMRIASKRLLRDLWREARRIHAEELAAATSAAAPRA